MAELKHRGGPSIVSKTLSTELLDGGGSVRQAMKKLGLGGISPSPYAGLVMSWGTNRGMLENSWHTQVPGTTIYYR